MRGGGVSAGALQRGVRKNQPPRRLGLVASCVVAYHGLDLEWATLGDYTAPMMRIFGQRRPRADPVNQRGLFFLKKKMEYDPAEYSRLLCLLEAPRHVHIVSCCVCVFGGERFGQYVWYWPGRANVERERI